MTVGEDKWPLSGAAMAAQAFRHVAGDCRGENFYELDPWLQHLLPLHLDDERLLEHAEPHLRRLGEIAGGRLDELAFEADRHPPVLHPRDRLGRDEEWIEYHPAYGQMEQIAFADFGLHAMSHRGGVLGWPDSYPAVAKYAFQYLFVQAEFGLMCPVSVSDTSAHLVKLFAGDELRSRLLPRMLSQDLGELWKGAQFMTEKAGGSDVGAIEARAVRGNGSWSLYGEKWFCSHADADVALVLARPEGAPPGTRGLALFAMPRRLENGRRNHYRIVRLKDKLGTRSMASGEILLEGASAWLVGHPERGFKQMMQQVNLSRLSHGVRAAAMMRRCLNEALVVARERRAFGRRLVEMPLVRRQLLELMMPTEQALSTVLFAAGVMDRVTRGDEEAALALRLLTPLVKFRACRDNLAVATAAMEIRGGNGYVEDWVNPRLVRDAHIGVIWEGTSNVVALDAVTRAVVKERGHEALIPALRSLLEESRALPDRLATGLAHDLDKAAALAVEVGSRDELEAEMPRAASALYHATSAALLAWEGSRLVEALGDARRLLLAQLVRVRRLAPDDPLAPSAETQAGARAAELLLAGEPVPIEEVAPLIS